MLEQNLTAEHELCYCNKFHNLLRSYEEVIILQYDAHTEWSEVLYLPERSFC